MNSKIRRISSFRCRCSADGSASDCLPLLSQPQSQPEQESRNGQRESWQQPEDRGILAFEAEHLVVWKLRAAPTNSKPRLIALSSAPPGLLLDEIERSAGEISRDFGIFHRTLRLCFDAANNLGIREQAPA